MGSCVGEMGQAFKLSHINNRIKTRLYGHPLRHLAFRKHLISAYFSCISADLRASAFPICFMTSACFHIDPEARLGAVIRRFGVIDAAVRTVTKPCRPRQYDARVKAGAEFALVIPLTTGTISCGERYRVSIEIIRAVPGGLIAMPISLQLPN